MEIQRVNAGGVLKPEEVIGRDDFITACWRTLHNQSLYIVGERRIGKSSIVRDRMGNQPVPGFRIVYMDVANVDAPLYLVNELLRAVKPVLEENTRAKLSVLQVLQRFAPELDLKIIKLPASLAPHWKELLKTVLEDVARCGTQLVLVFDELPLMLDKIKQSAGERVAMDVLDTLRQERQTQERLRMVYTGSLGLHHVLTTLQEANYQNSPINDLRPMEVGPLTEDFAAALALRLLNGLSIPFNDPEQLARHLARITHGMPFYIQNLVSDLRDSEGSDADTGTLDGLLTQRINNISSDSWDLGYYEKRIDTHYQAETRGSAKAFLDQLAVATTPQTFDDLLDGLDPAKITVDEEIARRTLELLGKDHYIARDEAGAYQFRYPLLARAWAYRRPQRKRR